MKKPQRKRNIDADKLQEMKDRAVTFLERVGSEDSAEKLENESLESYAMRKGFRLDENPRQLKPAHKLTNRGKRYRANHPTVRPKGARKCALCGSRRFVVVDHRNGRESDCSPRNLRWLCKSCNTRLGIKFAKMGKGERVNGKNPGAKTLGAYVAAAKEHTRGARDAGGKVIHETPKAKRRSFAREIWSRRRYYGTERAVANPHRKARKRNVVRIKIVAKNSRGKARTAKRAKLPHGRRPNVVRKAPRASSLRCNRKTADPIMALMNKLGIAPAKAKTAANKYRRLSNPQRSAISAKIRALRAEGYPQSQAVAIALGMQRAGRLKEKRRSAKPKGAFKFRPNKHRRRRNNGSALDHAGDTYAMFHGREPDQVVTVTEMTGDPNDLAGLGDLVSLVVGENDYQLNWGAKERPLLATDPDAEQLYIVGGNQDLSEALRGAGMSASNDLLDLGEVARIEYFTYKDFDNFEPTVYYHSFGEEDMKKNPRRVRRPRLVWSRRNKKLMLVGGAYKIKKDGIIN